MLKSSGADRQARRKSSGSTSRSSLATVRPLEPSRSPSRSRLSSSSTIATNPQSMSADTLKPPPSNGSRSSSSKRSSGGSKTLLVEKRPHDGLSQPAYFNLSVEQQEKSSNAQRSISSAVSHGIYSGMSQRSSSPLKKARPTDIPLDGSKLAAATGLMARGGTAFPLESPLPTSEAPRSPLLHFGQISVSGTGEDSIFQGTDSGFGSQEFFPRSSLRTGTGGSQSTSSSGESNILQSSPKPGRTLMTAGSLSHGQLENHTQRRNDDIQYLPDPTESRSPPQRTRLRRDKDKKTMLANALQRANDAVQLDNSQDYAGAIDAYIQACDFLTEVMNKSSSEDDKRKLRAIRSTYTDRIREIRQLEVDVESSSESQTPETSSFEGFAPTVRSSLGGAYDMESTRIRQVADAASSRPNNLLSSTSTAQQMEEYHSGVSFDPLTRGLAPPQTLGFVPAPLSPRRPAPEPPIQPASPGELVETSNDTHADSRSSDLSPSAAGQSSSSWLEHVEHTGGSSPASSHHSVSSRNQLRRKHLRVHSSNTEAEFDAALDAAVEAAYDDGYEPYSDEAKWSLEKASKSYQQPQPSVGESVQTGKADRQPDESRNLVQSLSNDYANRNLEDESPSDESQRFDDEERMLQEGQEYLKGGQDAQSTPSLPRQSNSSSSSGRTWGSSVASSLTNAGTPLSTVDEHALVPPPTKYVSSMHLPPSAPPPTAALPLPPHRGTGSASQSKSGLNQNRSTTTTSLPSSVQDRRLSGQKGRRLKIETTVGPDLQSYQSEDGNVLPAEKISRQTLAPTVPPKPIVSMSPVQTASMDEAQSRPARQSSWAQQVSSPFSAPFQAVFTVHSDSSASMSTPALPSALSNDDSLRPSPSSTSPGHSSPRPQVDRGALKTNGSSLSLRNKGLLTPGTPVFERSPVTPSSLNFSVTSPMNVTAINPAVESSGDLHLSSPRAQPRPLEPCPESQLLRPYWLMRCFYQTISHPDGGYLTTSLCIPRKVWQVANVKLKHMEEKVANCDLLSAALHQLGTIDTFDADAVLEEMEAFETVMAQVQTNLAKKLGNDVGPQNISSLFKDAPVTSPVVDGISRSAGSAEAVGNTNSTSSGRSSSKGYFSSLRKLRGKTSDASLAKGYMSLKESPGADMGTISTVPMTASLLPHSSRAAKRDGVSVVSTTALVTKTDGPQASYMGAICKLCDAVQILDQIARQVEDPGLKHSSPTHVGLELSSKHASEFFGLYICRFILQDITMLAEKHVKRASEYVLS